MGKKKNKKYKNHFSSWEDLRNPSKKDKKGKKNREDGIKATLGKKDAKANRKIIMAPVEVPASFSKSRRECNHAGDTLTAAEFRNMTPAYSAYTPLLDEACGRYGEDHVHVCKACFDVLVDRDQINIDMIKGAMTTLYLASNMVVANVKMKDDEVEDLNKAKDRMMNFATKLVAIMTENIAANEAETSGGGDSKTYNQNAGLTLE